MTPTAQAERFRSFPRGVYVSSLLSGTGAVLIGALLPSLSRVEHLNDRQSGLLIGAQFLGNFLGAVSISSNPYVSLPSGQLAAAVGLLLASAVVASSAPVALLYLCLAIFGFGLGQMITAVNLIVGSERDAKRAAHLSLLNLLWGLGAMASPLAVALAMRWVSIATIFTTFSLLPLLLLCASPQPAAQSWTTPPARLPSAGTMQGRGIVLSFALVFFFYGGTENSLSGWLSTYAQRYAGAHGSPMTLVTAAFWAGINVGRAAGAVLLRHVSERRAIRWATGSFLLCACALVRAQSSVGTLVLAALCGLCLAPVFPAALSWLVGLDLPSRRIGFLLALCGLGGSTLPALVGFVSFHVASLRKALVLPIVYAVCVLLVLPSRRLAAASRDRASR